MTDYPTCSVQDGGFDPTAIVGLSALACTLASWVFLIIVTSCVGGRKAWRKGAVYYASYSMSIVGLYLLLTYSTLWEFYWSEANPDCRLPESLSFMLTLGFPLVIIPHLLINWRIVCIFSTTYDWRLRRVSPMVVQDRGAVWLMTRFAALFLPFIILYVLTVVCGQVVEYVIIAFEAVLAFLLAALSVYLVCLRDRIRATHPLLVNHMIYTVVLAFTFIILFVTRTVLFYAYPSKQIPGDALDMSLAWWVFLNAIAIVALWLHYLLVIGRSSASHPATKRLVQMGNFEGRDGGRITACYSASIAAQPNPKTESASVPVLPNAASVGSGSSRLRIASGPSLALSLTGSRFLGGPGKKLGDDMDPEDTDEHDRS